jgi:hypothetical protein
METCITGDSPLVAQRGGDCHVGESQGLGEDEGGEEFSAVYFVLRMECFMLPPTYGVGPSVPACTCGAGEQ